MVVPPLQAVDGVTPQHALQGEADRVVRGVGNSGHVSRKG
jgi:hypothetical protein